MPSNPDAQKKEPSQLSENIEIPAIPKQTAGAVAGAAVGSIAGPIGAVVGGLFIQTLTTTLYARNVSSDVSPVPKALVIIAVCLFQSESFRTRLSRFVRPSGRILKPLGSRPHQHPSTVTSHDSRES